MRRGEKGLNDFKFGTFMGRFRNDGAASMAVRGLSFEMFYETQRDLAYAEPKLTVVIEM